jgi:hypothetical protein
MSALLRCIDLVPVLNLLAFPLVSSPPYVDPGKGMKESKNVEQPKNHGDDNDAVED